MITSELVTRALKLANLQDDDAELREETREALKDGVRKYSGVMGYAQDVIEHTPTATDFTIGKPVVKRGRRLSYVYDELPSLDDYETCGYVKDRDCIYRESNDTFYKIVQTGTSDYAWQTFISSDYTTYFMITPQVIIVDLDNVQAIVDSVGGSLEQTNLTNYLRGKGDFVVNPVAESVYSVKLRSSFVTANKPLNIVYGKLVNLTDATNVCLSNDYLDLLILSAAYNVAKTTKAKEMLGARLSEAEAKVLDTNECDSYMIVPDSYLG